MNNGDKTLCGANLFVEEEEPADAVRAFNLVSVNKILSIKFKHAGSKL